MAMPGLKRDGQGGDAERRALPPYCIAQAEHQAQHQHGGKLAGDDVAERCFQQHRRYCGECLGDGLRIGHGGCLHYKPGKAAEQAGGDAGLGEPKPPPLQPLGIILRHALQGVGCYKIAEDDRAERRQQRGHGDVARGGDGKTALQVQA